MVTLQAPSHHLTIYTRPPHLLSNMDSASGGLKTAGSLVLPDIVDQPPFLLKLRYIVDDPKHDDAIAWCDGGRSIVIRSEHVLVNSVLPSFFKTRQLPSFIRQLHLYGFSKVNGYAKSVNGRRPEVVFRNENFVRDQPELMKYIKREPTKGKKPKPLATDTTSYTVTPSSQLSQSSDSEGERDSDNRSPVINAKPTRKPRAKSPRGVSEDKSVRSPGANWPLSFYDLNGAEVKPAGRRKSTPYERSEREGSAGSQQTRQSFSYTETDSTTRHRTADRSLSREGGSYPNQPTNRGSSPLYTYDANGDDHTTGVIVDRSNGAGSAWGGTARHRSNTEGSSTLNPPTIVSTTLTHHHSVSHTQTRCGDVEAWDGAPRGPRATSEHLIGWSTTNDTSNNSSSITNTYTTYQENEATVMSTSFAGHSTSYLQPPHQPQRRMSEGDSYAPRLAFTTTTHDNTGFSHFYTENESTQHDWSRTQGIGAGSDGGGDSLGYGYERSTVQSDMSDNVTWLAQPHWDSYELGVDGDNIQTEVLESGDGPVWRPF